MSQYQLIALDMDGTLLNSKKEISPGCREAIKKALAEGKEVVLSPGRCRPELTEFRKLIPGLRYVNCTSGAMVYDFREQRVIYSNTIDIPVVKEIFRLARKEEAMLHILDEKSIEQTNQLAHIDRYGMGVYKELHARVVEPHDDLYGFYMANPFPVEKINLYHQSMESRTRTKERIQALALPVEMVDAESSSLELTATGVDKGVGLTKLCEALGIPVSASIAVGDADNDLSVLRAAGLAVAMGNALDSVKAISDVTVADCDHDGCAEAIYKYLLG